MYDLFPTWMLSLPNGMMFSFMATLLLGSLLTCTHLTGGNSSKEYVWLFIISLIMSCLLLGAYNLGGYSTWGQYHGLTLLVFAHGIAVVSISLVLTMKAGESCGPKQFFVGVLTASPPFVMLGLIMGALMGSYGKYCIFLLIIPSALFTTFHLFGVVFKLMSLSSQGWNPGGLNLLMYLSMSAFAFCFFISMYVFTMGDVNILIMVFFSGSVFLFVAAKSALTLQDFLHMKYGDSNVVVSVVMGILAAVRVLCMMALALCMAQFLVLFMLLLCSV